LLLPDANLYGRQSKSGLYNGLGGLLSWDMLESTHSLFCRWGQCKWHYHYRLCFRY
jgi:hypothetical protein